MVTEPLIDDENESGRKCLVHVPVVSNQSGSGRTRTRATSFHTARESLGSARNVPQQQRSDDIELPELSTRMSCAVVILLSWKC